MVALTAAAATAAKVIAGLIAADIGVLGLTASDSQRLASKAHDKFYAGLKAEGLDSVSVRDLYDYALDTSKISKEEYKRGLNILDQMEKHTNGKFEWADVAKYLGHLPATNMDAKEFYETMTKIIPDFSDYVKRAANLTPEGFRDRIISSLPAVSDVPRPTYYNVNSVTDDNLKDVRPMYLPTGQELADYNGINYDPNYYYDLIKQGTEAAVNYADFQNKVTNNNSMLQDTVTNNSYLDSIRSAKQDAIAKGATAGARAANELLATSDAMGNYSNTQMKSADTQMQNISKPLLQDAQAQLTARDYFNKLAQNLMTSGLTFYDSDATRYGAEWDRNATLYQGNNALRAGYDTANAMMNAAYNQNQATVNAARSGLNSMANQYAWLFERGLDAYGNDPNGTAHALRNVLQYITSNATNGQFNNYLDYNVAQNNK